MVDFTDKIKLAHYDDGKQKCQSHEIYLREDIGVCYPYDLLSHDIFEARGYGATREEALNDLKNKLNFLFDELKILETKLFETNELEDDIIEVDYSGIEIVDES